MIKEFAEEVKEKAEDYIDQTKGTARIYVEKGKAVSETYDKAKSYSTENPALRFLSQ